MSDRDEIDELAASFGKMHDSIVFDPPPEGWESLEVFVAGKAVPMQEFIDSLPVEGEEDC